jgi:hypothetical protein
VLEASGEHVAVRLQGELAEDVAPLELYQVYPEGEQTIRSYQYASERAIRGRHW